MTVKAISHKHRASKPTASDREWCRRQSNDHCHLCGYKVRHASEGSVDHKIAVAAGGSSLLSNYAYAHKTCNEFRSNRRLTVELRAECRRRFQQLYPKEAGVRRVSEAFADTHWPCFVDVDP